MLHALDDLRDLAFIMTFIASVVLVTGLMWIGLMGALDAVGLIEPRPEVLLTPTIED